MSDVTRILSQIESGDPSAAEQLLPLVYQELRKLAAAKLAQEKPGQTLQATALVHEAYLRLVGPGVRGQESGVGEPLIPDSRPLTPASWDSRGHFFAAAAEAMRRILIDKARQKQRPKHGGERRRFNLDEVSASVDQPGDDLLALDEALTALNCVAPRKAELVKLRFFAGLTIPEAAAALGISAATAQRDWTYARTWLFCHLADQPPPENSSEYPSTA
jgi:RNA polymerase sigma factor (sigma-70 family)